MSTVPQWSMNEDRKLLRIGFPGERPMQQYEAYQLDELIAGLVEMRGAMYPELPMCDPEPGSRVLVATRGRFYVQGRPQEDAVARSIQASVGRNDVRSIGSTRFDRQAAQTPS
jgi:hypothetical protein